MTELKTSVDQLMQLVEEKQRISLSDAAKQLGVSEKTVLAWVDFLVEEHILGVEYKFTTPFLYVNSKERLEAVQEETAQLITLSDFKQAFKEHAKTKGMPEEKLPSLWKEHLKYVAASQKSYFVQEAERRGIAAAQDLYEQYLEELINAA